MNAVAVRAALRPGPPSDTWRHDLAPSPSTPPPSDAAAGGGTLRSVIAALERTGDDLSLKRRVSAIKRVRDLALRDRRIAELADDISAGVGVAVRDLHEAATGDVLDSRSVRNVLNPRFMSVLSSEVSVPGRVAVGAVQDGLLNACRLSLSAAPGGPQKLVG